MAERLKPFVCSHLGCNMSFASEDRLNAHRVSHTSKVPLIPTFIADLTPTPTRFLRSCEEVGLFNEITRNPFDDCFIQASDRSREATDNHSEALPRQPAPIPNVILEHSLADDADDHNLLVESDFAISGELSNQEQDEEADFSSGDNITQLVSVEADLGQQQLQQQHTLDTTHESSQQLVQVLVQLQTGVFMPVQISAQALNQAMNNLSPSCDVASNLQPLTPAPPLAPAEELNNIVSTSTIAPSTKQKLKEALKHNMNENLRKALIQSSAPKSVSSQNVVEGPSYTKSMKLSLTDGVHVSHVQSQPADTSTSQIFSKLSSDEELEDQKKKFLESNRAAATRCRQKKKIWIDNLESKTKDLQHLNKQLTEETCKLRKEIIKLKQMLSEHSDCSVPTPTVIRLPSNMILASNFMNQQDG